MRPGRGLGVRGLSRGAESWRNPSGGTPVLNSKIAAGHRVLRRFSCRQGRRQDEIGGVCTAPRRRPRMRAGIGRRGGRPACGTLFAVAAPRGGCGSVHLFMAGPSAAAAAVPKSLRVLSRQLRLCRPLRPHLPGLFLLAGRGRLLSRRSWLLRGRRQPALWDMAVGVSVQLRGAQP